jgi:SM-20-related protein
MSDEEKLEQNQFEELIQGLIDNKFGCSNNFLMPSTMSKLRDNMTALTTSGNMKIAGIGNKMDYQKNALIRSDKVNWIEDQSSNQYEEVYLKKMWRFINHLNNTCFTSILSFESHYANFEVGSFYKKHIDQFKSEKGRKFSVVLYLNQDWTEADQGTLSIYPLNSAPINISPVEGRIVFFRSDEMEHEVNPSLTRERRSIAGWMKN